MRSLIFTLVSVLSLSVYGQDSTEDSIPPIRDVDALNKLDKLMKTDLRKERLNNYLDIDHSSEYAVSNFKPSLNLTEKSKIDTLDLKLPPLKVYYYPTIDTNPINMHYPFANDYNLSAAYKLSDKAWLATNSNNITYPTLGVTRTVNARLGYDVTDWLSISGGTYVSKYSINNNQFNDIGVNGALRLKATDNIRFNVYGQYSRNGKQNGVGGPMSSMYQQSYYGGTVEFKFSDSFGIEAGMQRELNPFTGKWENRPIISPVFYSKGKRR